MKITVTISGESVTFSNFRPIQPGCEGRYYCDNARRYFLKECKKNTIQNEIAALVKLQKYDKHFPKIVMYTKKFIVTEFIHGQALSKATIPPNIREQADTILQLLDTEHISHNDILLKQLIVNTEGILYLVDFGRAKINSPNPRNREAMYAILRQFGV